MRCEITWIPAESGGREALPTGPRYVTVAKFDEDEQGWQKMAWSVVLDFEPNQTLPVRFAEVKFLSAEGPVERLKPGRVFALFEGGKRVASVRLI